MRPEQLLESVNLLVKQKHLDRETVFKILEEVMGSIYEKQYEKDKKIVLTIDRATGNLTIYQKKLIVEHIRNEQKEISLEEVSKISPNASIGDEIMFLLEKKPYDRIFAQTVRQKLMQRITEEEKKNIFNDVKDLTDKIVSGKIQRIDKKNVYVNIGKTVAILPKKEQVRRDNYRVNDEYKFYVVQVEETKKVISVLLSRTHPKLVQKLFEEEIVEVAEHHIEIKGLARDPGFRTKIAIKTDDPTIDPIGACVGQKGNRIQYVVRELRGEKIDIIPYSDDITKFIVNALRPAEISKVQLNEKTRCAKIIVEKDQLSLAIGKNGQNAKLAHKLTGWKIDIFTQKEYDDIIAGLEKSSIENDLFKKEFNESVDTKNSDDSVESDASADVKVSEEASDMVAEEKSSDATDEKASEETETDSTDDKSDDDDIVKTAADVSADVSADVKVSEEASDMVAAEKSSDATDDKASEETESASTDDKASEETESVSTEDKSDDDDIVKTDADVSADVETSEDKSDDDSKNVK